jgi:serine/threonine-protein kinase
MRSANQILFELGRGGAATVSLAVSLGPAGFTKLIVVKRLHEDLAADETAVDMFTLEARVTARLNHPNIVHVFDIALENDEYTIEMEYLEGQSFEAVVRRAAVGERLPTELGVWVLTQVLAGLDFAHDLRGTDGAPLDLVHRDVSPHNVLVTYEGTVKVLDFGIAKARESGVLTETGIIKGKLAYMSPEQALHEPVDRRTDVFAVGVILWQLLTGTRLWAGKRDADLYTRLIRGDIPSPRSVRGDVPEELERICMRALSLRREDRFATAAEMAAALEHHLETTSPRTGPRTLAQWMGRAFATERDTTRTRIEARLAELGRSTREAATAEPTPTGERASRDPVYRVAGSTVTKATLSRSAEVVNGRWGRAQTLVAVVALLVASVASVAWISSRRTKSAPMLAPIASSASTAACAASRDCGGDRVCRAGQCVALASEDCRVVASANDIANDTTAWVGVMFPENVADAEPSYARSVELARDDFLQQTSGIAPSSGVGSSRPIGLVICNDAIDPARVARHLVDLRVPAVIGFRESKEVIALSTTTFLPNGMLVLAATNPSSFITSIPQPSDGPRLVWRTTVDTSFQAKPFASLVAEVFEPRLRAKLGPAPTTPLRVALARTDHSVGLGFSTALFATLRFNGRSVLENGASFAEIVLPLAVLDAPRLRPSVDALLAFRPHLIIVDAAGRDLTRAVYAELEARWPRDAMRPVYLIKDYPHREEFGAFLNADAERSKRFFGVTVPFATPVNVKLTNHFNEHASQRVTLASAPRDPYDAFYVFAYAAFAAGDGPLTGTNLARGIARLVPPGTHIDVGPAEIFDAFRVLRSGANIDLNGAGSSLDFDLATGDPASDLVLLCARPSPSGGIALDESGIVYDAKAKTLRGHLACP